MENCYLSAKTHRDAWIALFVLSCFGVFCMGSAIKFAFLEFHFIYLLLFLIGIFLLLLGVFLYALDTCKYKVNADGVTVCYFPHIIKYFAWSEISDICVCDVNHAPKNYSVFDIVIRIEVKSRNYKSAKKALEYPSETNRWRQSEYNLIHFRNIILIEYSDIRYQKIKELSKQDIQWSLTKHAQKCFDKEENFGT